MQLKNKIINYFVSPPIKGETTPRVFHSLVTINPNTARSLIENWLKRNDQRELPPGPLLHVCYDFDSKMIYSPNAHEFEPNRFEYLLKAAEVRITKDYGGFSSRPVIKSSPFSSLRVRSIDSFQYVSKIIKEHGDKTEDIPVIEANLKRMPSIIKNLPPLFANPKFMGGYISRSFVPSITFIDEIENSGRKRKEPVIVLNQPTPFILINLSANDREDRAISAADKEFVVLTGYRDYLYDHRQSKTETKGMDKAEQYADLFAFKRYLYLGWPFEDVCILALRVAKDFGSLINAISLLMTTIESLVKEGYDNPAKVPYYTTFKIGTDFPYKFTSFIDEGGKFKTESQYDYFRIIEYDPKNSYILIESFVYLPQDVCNNILKAKSPPFISKYNNITNTIDIKSSNISYSDIKKNKIQLDKIDAIISYHNKDKKNIQFKLDPTTHARDISDSESFSVRNVSEYYYAVDVLKDICKKYDLKFENFNVVVGPLQSLLGSGVSGAYMDANLFRENKMPIPYEIVKGIKISPPVMFIDSETAPNYADHTTTIIHEYVHHLFGLKNPGYKPTYGKSKGKGVDYEYWSKYFNDPSEREAHRHEIKLELQMGKSYDEIIRDKVGMYVTEENHPIALKFSDLVMEAMKEIEEEEKNEEPT